MWQKYFSEILRSKEFTYLLLACVSFLKEDGEPGSLPDWKVLLCDLIINELMSAWAIKHEDDIMKTPIVNIFTMHRNFISVIC